MHRLESDAVVAFRNRSLFVKGRKTASGLLRGLIIGVHSRPFAVPLYEE